MYQQYKEDMRMWIKKDEENRTKNNSGQDGFSSFISSLSSSRHHVHLPPTHIKSV
jgi:hypothetical protein